MKDKNIEDIYELSPMQQGILFHTLAAPNSGVYFEQSSYTLQGKLDILAFKRAWQQVVNRHPVLRTSFHWEGLDKPYQVVYRQVDLPWEQQDWRKLSTSEQQKQLEAFLQAERERGFELSQAPLIRMALFQIAEDTYQFVQSHHHLLLDGWSWWGQIVKEVHRFYNAFCQSQVLNLERPRPYRDYIAWLQQQDLSKAEEFWRQKLKGFTTPTPLVVDRAPGSLPSQSEDCDRQWTLLSQPLTASLQSIARQHQLTVNTLLQGAWALLLSRYSGEEDVIFGATSSGRPTALEGVESMVGLFVNTLPLRVQVPPEAFLLPWLKQLQIQQLEVSQYEYSPLRQLQEWSEIPRGLPLFESIYVFNNYPVSSKSRLSTSLEISNYKSFEKTNYPLCFVATPALELRLEIKYDTRRFEADIIDRMLGHLKTLLASMVANPHQRLSSMPLLTAAEQHQILEEWNYTLADYPQGQCIHQIVEAQVEHSPDTIAVVFEDQHLTYQELNARANRIAHHLQTLGVEPETLVGICLERSLEMVLGLLGILKAGGAYVPLDPAYPPERLAFMLQDAKVSVLLTQAQFVESLPKHWANIICLDTDWDTFAQQSSENPINTSASENLAYVIYTSGSTGLPKGVLVTHQNIVHSTSARIAYYQEPVTTFLLIPSFAFDSSVAVIFWTLCQGGTLLLLKEGLQKDIWALTKLIAQHRASHWLSVPSLYEILLAQIEPSKGEQGTGNREQGRLGNTDFLSLNTTWHELVSLRTVIVAGESCSSKLVEHHHQLLPHASLFNEYGPTEGTVWSSVYDCQNHDLRTPVSIGCPIANTQIYLLNSYGQSVPVGVPGELYIGGLGIARGYLNHPELTAEKFIPNPFKNSKWTASRCANKVQNSKLYKTGDLARYLPNGNCEYLGRIDHQVKIRGFRIELSEIEAVLSQHLQVRQAVVVARDDKFSSQYLVAYVIPHIKLQSSAVDRKDEEDKGDKEEKVLCMNATSYQQESVYLIDELQTFLKDRLPAYMVPAAFVMLDSLPLTPNGKVDRQRLPEPNQARPELQVVYEAPHTELEQTIAQVWQEVLQVEKVGIYDNFFELGGHSLLLVKVHSRLKEKCGQHFSMVAMFQYPTINYLAKYLGQKQVEEYSSSQIYDNHQSFIDSIEQRRQVRKKRQTAIKPRNKY